MNSQGASISDERNGEIHDILFPNHSGHVSHIALDVSVNTITKIIYQEVYIYVILIGTI
jgi:hypothetical protein